LQAIAAGLFFFRTSRSPVTRASFPPPPLIFQTVQPALKPVHANAHEIHCGSVLRMRHPQGEPSEGANIRLSPEVGRPPGAHQQVAERFEVLRTASTVNHHGTDPMGDGIKLRVFCSICEQKGTGVAGPHLAFSPPMGPAHEHEKPKIEIRAGRQIRSPAGLV